MSFFNSLWGSGFFLYFAVIQVIFAVHCVRTGRNMFWLWIILMFSVIGCLVYFLAEILPALGSSPALRRMQRSVSGVFDPDRDLRRKGANFAISNNVETTCAYAEQLMHKGQYDEAISLLNASRKGLFRNDPTLLTGLARAHFESRRYPECIAVLEELMQHNPEYKSSDMRLLHAMALEADNQTDAALRQYQIWGESHPGPEAKCRYAMLLKKMGEPEKAHALFKDIRLYAVNAPKHYRRQHKEWVDMALRECKLAEEKAG